MDRREFITLVPLGLLAAPFAAEAQQVGKVYRIGMLETKASRRTEVFRAQPRC